MTKTRDLSDFLIEGGADLPLGKPHIVPGVLYPSYVASGTSNKLLDGTTDHSGAFGTEQSDGRKYYYTNIAGSKPIKDPRIGAHFGSQRHKFKSLQLLEQETATHGDDVFSIDGREWCRAVGGSDAVIIKYDDDGHYIQTQGTAGTIEITGYFNAVNLLAATWMTATNTVLVAINGVTAHSAFALNASVATPLGNRYVDQSSVYNIDITSSSSLSADTSLGINTIKIKHVTGDSKLHGIELIAQDTTSTANRSKIQIPAQNVVSFGKKFPISATSAHYDPFNGMSAGSNEATLGTLIDLNTSLGMDQWKGGTANYYRPFQGGRVIKWVDSTGAIKTSVTMMPANADNTGSTASNALGNTEIQAGTNNHTINFTNNGTTTEYTTRYQEVAKTFHFREFGNGSANGGNSGSYPDLSTLVRSSGTHNGTFIMDDGLTGLSYFNMYDYSDYGLRRNNDGDLYLTFIGTGLTIKGKTYRTTVASNLPYGTHVFRQKANGTSGSADGGDWYIDGVLVRTFSGASGTVNQLGDYGILELTIHQPKRPAVPEDCVVLADYMLMADFVPNSGFGPMKISKGVREVDASRDIFYDAADSFTTTQYSPAVWRGMRIHNNGNGTSDFKLPFFGNGVIFRSHAYTDRADNAVFKINSDVYDTNFNSAGNYSASNRVGCTSPTPWDASEDGTFNFRQNTNGTNSNEGVGVKNLQLGLNELHIDSPQYVVVCDSIEVANPIHTSSHYQTFESPFLHELVGGDRNMEQTNLVCSPDGKTWDEITRDTSYITLHTGMHCGGTPAGSDPTVNGNELLFQHYQVYRGSTVGVEGLQKNFALASDRIICLEDGHYICSWGARASSGLEFQLYLFKNSTSSSFFTSIDSNNHGGDRTGTYRTVSFSLKRGDYLAVKTGNGLKGDTAGHYTSFHIKKA